MVVDLMHVSFGCPCDLSYGVQWDRVKPLFNSEHQSLDDGQCERQFKPERRPLTGLGFYRNGPLQTMENALHHIHPDSPAGDLGNFLSSAETGLEDVFEHLGFAKPRGFFCPDQSNFDSFGAYFAYIDAATIVADSHNHLIAVMISIELDCALGLPALTRSSADSIPCPTALRTMWVSGSAMASRMLLSRSVSCPLTTNSTSLPHCLPTSRTTRGKRRNSCSTGTIRIFITDRCRSFNTRDWKPIASEKRLRRGSLA